MPSHEFYFKPSKMNILKSLFICMSPYFSPRKLHQDVWKERQEEEITKF